MANSNLSKARKEKNDEFYTRFDDIQAEMNHYNDKFKGKTVLCNCDDPYESNFCLFFLRNFHFLGLHRLICTSYYKSSIAGRQMTIYDLMGKPELNKEHGYVLDVSEDVWISDHPDNIDKVIKSGKYVHELKGDGDFRSKECLKYLKECDVVVTNPPFSLFREFMALLVKYKKEFLIIGNQNAITYKEIFPLIKDNKMWLGYPFKGNVGFFSSPYNDYAKSSQHKEGLIRISGVCWFTNIDYKRRHYPILTYKRMELDAKDFPHYDNYDAIEIPQVKMIPQDYKGVMGVPITFMDKYCPEQFEILGINTNDKENMWRLKTKTYTPEDDKKFTTLNASSVLLKDGSYKPTYARIFIKYTDDWVDTHTDDFVRRYT